MSSLPAFLKQRGDETVARETGRSIHTVRSWRLELRKPNIQQAKALIKLYGLRWEDIYGPV